jgi:carboxyl-terminal processing protease
MTLPRPRRILPFALLAAAGLFFWLERPALQSSKFPPPQDFGILASAVRHIRSDYVDEADPKRTMEGAFQGLMGSLDIMSSYLDASLMTKAASPRKDKLFDIGLAVYKRPGVFPVVVGVGEGSPAEKAGIKVGDAVSAVDDRSTLSWSYNELRFVLKDADRKPVKIRLIHENSTSEKTLDRAPAYPVAIAWTAEKGTSGVVRVHHLFPGAAAEFKTAVLPRLSGKKEPLILDLRGCREGEIEEARAFINLFLKNDRAGTFEKKGGQKDVFACSADPVVAPDLPLIVWVSPATMGPSEIAAGVLRDLKRAKIVGTATTGLTAEQKLFPLETGDGLLLTIGVFVLPSGEKIFSKGLTADAKIDLDKQTRAAYLEKTIGLIAGR